MRKIIAFLLVLITVFSLVGCQKSGEETPAADGTTAQGTQNTEKEEPTGGETDKTPETDGATSDNAEEEYDAVPDEDTETEDDTSSLPVDSSYTEKITRPDQQIFGGPSYDYNYVGVVSEAGVYTIVEEATDDEGNLWGKLKSGVGWVDLTEIRSFDWPISAGFADEKLLESGNYHHYTVENQDYITQVAIRAYEELSYVTIYPMEFTDDGFVAGEAVFYIEKLTPDKPLVADLTFPGDMSMYTIEFTTAKGADTYIRIYISGRNGTLVMDDGEF